MTQRNIVLVPLLAVLSLPLLGCATSSPFINNGCLEGISGEVLDKCAKPADKDDLVDLVALGAKCASKQSKLVDAVKQCQTAPAQQLKK